MVKLRDLKRKKLKILIYGPVGVGKTGLALTLGKQAQILDLDEGLMTGLTMKDKFFDARNAVDVVQALEEKTSVSTQFMKAKAKILSAVNQSIKGEYGFEYFVVDSLTALVESAVNGVLSNSDRLGKAPEIQHWGLAFIEVKNVLLMLRTMPCSVVMTAHEQIKEIDKVNNVMIATPGQRLPMEVTRYFDEVWRLRLQNEPGGGVKHVLQTKGTAGVRVRSRSNLPDNTDADLGLPAILDMIKPTEGGEKA